MQKPSPTIVRNLRVRHIALLAVIVLYQMSWAEQHTLASPGGSRATLVKHAALILTMDASLGDGPLGLIEGGDLLFEDGTIRAVGRELHAPDATVVDASGLVLLPGFVDVHDHLYQSVLRGACADEDLLGWLARCALPATRSLSDQEAYDTTRLSTLGLIATGVTTVVDWVPMIFSPEVAAADLRALADSGLRFVFGYSPQNATLEIVRDFKTRWIDPNPLARLHLSGGTHPTHAKHLAGIVPLARTLGVQANVHLLEHVRQRDDHPLALLEQTGALALGPALMVNHAIHVLPDEITRLAQHGVRVAHCPLSNMRLGSGTMRLPEFHAAGIKVGLGLDGGTNDTADFFNLMRIAVGLQRARAHDAKVYPSITDVLRMATIGGAEVLGMEAIIGSLTPGKQADLIAVDPTGVNFAPAVEVTSQLVWNAQPANVRYVFVNGKLLKAGDEFIGISPESVIDAVQRTAERLKHRPPE